MPSDAVFGVASDAKRFWEIMVVVVFVLSLSLGTPNPYNLSQKYRKHFDPRLARAGGLQAGCEIALEPS